PILLGFGLSRSVPCGARVSSLCCGLRLTIRVAPGNRLTKVRTSRPLCFTTGFPGSPNGPSLQSFLTNSESVHRSGVTAEPYYAVRQPSNVVVLENVVREDTKGTTEAVNAKYELMERGGYIPTG